MARVKTYFFDEINRPEEDHSIQYEYEQHLAEQQNQSLMAKSPEKCDMCGDEIKGKSHPVYDENWNRQRGLKQCEPCRFNIQSHKNHEKPKGHKPNDLPF